MQFEIITSLVASVIPQIPPVYNPDPSPKIIFPLFTQFDISFPIPIPTIPPACVRSFSSLPYAYMVPLLVHPTILSALLCPAIPATDTPFSFKTTVVLIL